MLPTMRLEAQRDEKFESSAVSGVTLHYRSWGRGPTVLLLSGGPGASSDYLESVYAHVAASSRAILLDQRGTGRSVLRRSDSTTLTLRLAIHDIEALRQRLGVDRLILVGHSWGGQLAMAYLAAYPAHVRGLGSLAPAVLGSARPARSARDSVHA